MEVYKAVRCRDEEIFSLVIDEPIFLPSRKNEKRKQSESEFFFLPQKGIVHYTTYIFMNEIKSIAEGWPHYAH